MTDGSKKCGCNRQGCWDCYLDSIGVPEEVKQGEEGWNNQDTETIMFIVKAPPQRHMPTDQGISETQVVAWGVNRLLRELGVLLLSYGFHYTLWSKKRPKT